MCAGIVPDNIEPSWARNVQKCRVINAPIETKHLGIHLACLILEINVL